MVAMTMRTVLAVAVATACLGFSAHAIIGQANEVAPLFWDGITIVDASDDGTAAPILMSFPQLLLRDFGTSDPQVTDFNNGQPSLINSDNYPDIDSTSCDPLNADPDGINFGRNAWFEFYAPFAGTFTVRACQIDVTNTDDGGVYQTQRSSDHISMLVYDQGSELVAAQCGATETVNYGSTDRPNPQYNNADEYCVVSAPITVEQPGSMYRVMLGHYDTTADPVPSPGTATSDIWAVQLASYTKLAAEVDLATNGVGDNTACADLTRDGRFEMFLGDENENGSFEPVSFYGWTYGATGTGACPTSAPLSSGTSSRFYWYRHVVDKPMTITLSACDSTTGLELGPERCASVGANGEELGGAADGNPSVLSRGWADGIYIAVHDEACAAIECGNTGTANTLSQNTLNCDNTYDTEIDQAAPGTHCGVGRAVQFTAMPGQTYKIEVGTNMVFDPEFEGQIDKRQLAPSMSSSAGFRLASQGLWKVEIRASVLNDVCSAATEVTSFPVYGRLDLAQQNNWHNSILECNTQEQSIGGGVGSFDGPGLGRDVWFHYAPDAGFTDGSLYLLSTCFPSNDGGENGVPDADLDVAIIVYQASPAGSGCPVFGGDWGVTEPMGNYFSLNEQVDNVIACSDNWRTQATEATSGNFQPLDAGCAEALITLEAGQDYYIRIAERLPTGATPTQMRTQADALLNPSGGSSLERGEFGLWLSPAFASDVVQTKRGAVLPSELTEEQLAVVKRQADDVNLSQAANDNCETPEDISALIDAALVMVVPPTPTVNLLVDTTRWTAGAQWANDPVPANRMRLGADGFYAFTASTDGIVNIDTGCAATEAERYDVTMPFMPMSFQTFVQVYTLSTEYDLATMGACEANVDPVIDPLSDDVSPLLAELLVMPGYGDDLSLIAGADICAYDSNVVFEYDVATDVSFRSSMNVMNTEDPWLAFEWADVEAGEFDPTEAGAASATFEVHEGRTYVVRVGGATQVSFSDRADITLDYDVEPLGTCDTQLGATIVAEQFPADSNVWTSSTPVVTTDTLVASRYQPGSFVDNTACSDEMGALFITNRVYRQFAVPHTGMYSFDVTSETIGTDVNFRVFQFSDDETTSDMCDALIVDDPNTELLSCVSGAHLSGDEISAAVGDVFVIEIGSVSGATFDDGELTVTLTGPVAGAVSCYDSWTPATITNFPETDILVEGGPSPVFPVTSTAATQFGAVHLQWTAPTDGIVTIDASDDSSNDYAMILAMYEYVDADCDDNYSGTKDLCSGTASCTNVGVERGTTYLLVVGSSNLGDYTSMARIDLHVFTADPALPNDACMDIAFRNNSAFALFDQVAVHGNNIAALTEDVTVFEDPQCEIENDEWYTYTHVLDDAVVTVNTCASEIPVDVAVYGQYNDAASPLCSLGLDMELLSCSAPMADPTMSRPGEWLSCPDGNLSRAVRFVARFGEVYRVRVGSQVLSAKRDAAPARGAFVLELDTGGPMNDFCAGAIEINALPVLGLDNFDATSSDSSADGNTRRAIAMARMRGTELDLDMVRQLEDSCENNPNCVPDCGDDGEGFVASDVWFRYTPPVDVHGLGFEFTTCSGAQFTVVVYKADSCDDIVLTGGVLSTSHVGCDLEANEVLSNSEMVLNSEANTVCEAQTSVAVTNSGSAQFNIDTEGGETYYIRIGSCSGSMGDFDLTLNTLGSTVAVPVNDEPSGALPVTAGTFPVHNYGATSSPMADTAVCAATYSDIWYLYTAPAGGAIVTMELRGSELESAGDFGHLLQVQNLGPDSADVSDLPDGWTGSTTGSWPFACFDDGCSSATPIFGSSEDDASFEFTAQPGHSYLVRAGTSLDYAVTPMELVVEETALDACSTVTDLGQIMSPVLSPAVDFASATDGYTAQRGTCGAFGDSTFMYYSRYFTWTAPFDMASVEFGLNYNGMGAGTNGQAGVRIYRNFDSSVASSTAECLEQLMTASTVDGCADLIEGEMEATASDLEAGETVLIEVGFFSTTGCLAPTAPTGVSMLTGQYELANAQDSHVCENACLLGVQVPEVFPIPVTTVAGSGDQEVPSTSTAPLCSGPIYDDAFYVWKPQHDSIGAVTLRYCGLDYTDVAFAAWSVTLGDQFPVDYDMTMPCAGLSSTDDVIDCQHAADPADDCVDVTLPGVTANEAILLQVGSAVPDNGGNGRILLVDYDAAMRNDDLLANCELEPIFELHPTTLVTTGAIVGSVPINAFSLIGATDSNAAADVACPTGRDLWFAYTHLTSDPSVRLATCNSDVPTMVAVYESDPSGACPPLTTVACAADTGFRCSDTDPNWILEFDVVQGQTYYIAVGGAVGEDPLFWPMASDDDETEFHLDSRTDVLARQSAPTAAGGMVYANILAAPRGDWCPSAVTVDHFPYVLVPEDFTDIAQNTETIAQCGTTETDVSFSYDYWLRWESPITASNVYFSTCDCDGDADVGTSMAVYRTTTGGCGGLELENCNDDFVNVDGPSCEGSSSGASTVLLHVEAGEVFYIRIGTDSGTPPADPITITLNDSQAGNVAPAPVLGTCTAPIDLGMLTDAGFLADAPISFFGSTEDVAYYMFTTGDYAGSFEVFGLPIGGGADIDSYTVTTVVLDMDDDLADFCAAPAFTEDDMFNCYEINSNKRGDVEGSTGSFDLTCDGGITDELPPNSRVLVSVSAVTCDTGLLQVGAALAAEYDSCYNPDELSGLFGSTTISITGSEFTLHSTASKSPCDSTPVALSGTEFRLWEAPFGGDFTFSTSNGADDAFLRVWSNYDESSPVASCQDILDGAQGGARCTGQIQGDDSIELSDVQAGDRFLFEIGSVGSSSVTLTQGCEANENSLCETRFTLVSGEFPYDIELQDSDESVPPTSSLTGSQCEGKPIHRDSFYQWTAWSSGDIRLRFCGHFPEPAFSVWELDTTGSRELTGALTCPLNMEVSNACDPLPSVDMPVAEYQPFVSCVETEFQVVKDETYLFEFGTLEVSKKRDGSYAAGKLELLSFVECDIVNDRCIDGNVSPAQDSYELQTDGTVMTQNNEGADSTIMVGEDPFGNDGNLLDESTTRKACPMLNDVWYYYNHPDGSPTATLALSTLGSRAHAGATQQAQSTVRTRFAVYEGRCRSSQKLLMCSGVEGDQWLQNEDLLTTEGYVTVRPGRAYRIRVGAYPIEHHIIGRDMLETTTPPLDISLQAMLDEGEALCTGVATHPESANTSPVVLGPDQPEVSWQSMDIDGCTAAGVTDGSTEDVSIGHTQWFSWVVTSDTSELDITVEGMWTSRAVVAVYKVADLQPVSIPDTDARCQGSFGRASGCTCDAGSNGQCSSRLCQDGVCAAKDVCSNDFTSASSHSVCAIGNMMGASTRVSGLSVGDRLLVRVGEELDQSDALVFDQMRKRAASKKARNTNNMTTVSFLAPSDGGSGNEIGSSCSDAESISFSGFLNSRVSFSGHLGESPSGEVWYKFTTPSGSVGDFRVDTCGDSYDSAIFSQFNMGADIEAELNLEVFTGSCGGLADVSPQIGGCYDGGRSEQLENGSVSVMTFDDDEDFVAGTTYYVKMSASTVVAEVVTAPFEIEFSARAAPNCADDRIDLGDSLGLLKDTTEVGVAKTTLATGQSVSSTDEYPLLSDISCGSDTLYGVFYYEFTAPFAANYAFEMTGSGSAGIYFMADNCADAANDASCVFFSGLQNPSSLVGQGQVEAGSTMLLAFGKTSMGQRFDSETIAVYVESAPGEFTEFCQGSEAAEDVAVIDGGSSLESFPVEVQLPSDATTQADHQPPTQCEECQGVDIYNDRFYTWTLDNEGTATLRYCTDHANSAIAVYNFNSGCDALDNSAGSNDRCIACSTPITASKVVVDGVQWCHDVTIINQGGQSEYKWLIEVGLAGGSATPGQDYNGLFELIAYDILDANDNCVDGSDGSHTPFNLNQYIAGDPNVVSVDLLGSTTSDYADSCPNKVLLDQWYYYKPASDGTVTIVMDRLSDEPAPAFALYRGAASNACTAADGLRLLACGEYDGFYASQPDSVAAQIDVEVGFTYLLQVGTVDTDSEKRLAPTANFEVGEVQFEITFGGSGDSCSQAVDVTVEAGESVVLSTSDATRGFMLDYTLSGTCTASQPTADEWFKFVAPETGMFDIVVGSTDLAGCSVSSDSVFLVYEADSCGDVSESTIVGCMDDVAANQCADEPLTAVANVEMTAGNMYFVRVGEQCDAGCTAQGNDITFMLGLSRSVGGPNVSGAAASDVCATATDLGVLKPYEGIVTSSFNLIDGSPSNDIDFTAPAGVTCTDVFNDHFLRFVPGFDGELDVFSSSPDATAALELFEGDTSDCVGTMTTTTLSQCDYNSIISSGFRVTGGQSYMLRVGGTVWGKAVGTVTVDFDLRPLNDRCDDAIATADYTFRPENNEPVDFGTVEFDSTDAKNSNIDAHSVQTNCQQDSNGNLPNDVFYVLDTRDTDIGVGGSFFLNSCNDATMFNPKIAVYKAASSVDGEWCNAPTFDEDNLVESIVSIVSGERGECALGNCPGDQTGTRISVPVDPNSVYLVRIGGSDMAAGGKAVFAVSYLPNDECTSPLPLQNMLAKRSELDMEVVSDISVVTIGASTDGSPVQCTPRSASFPAPSNALTQIYHDVWYSWTPTPTAGADNFLVKITLDGFDGIMAAYLNNDQYGRRCPAFDGNLIGCADTSGAVRTRDTQVATKHHRQEMSASLTALFRSDSTYLIRIGGAQPEQWGEGDLSIEYVCGAGFDPEFVGFNGERFEVQGSHDGVYNVLSDEDMQMNVRYADPGCHHERTVIGEAGIKYKGHTIRVHPREGLTMDGYHVQAGEQYMIGDEQNAWVSVERHSAFPVFVVSTPKFSVHLEAALPNCERSSVLRLDMSISTKDINMVTRPEGLLGATMSRHSEQQERSMEEVASYRVTRSDLFSDEFAQNRYMGGRLEARDIDAMGSPRKRMASRSEMSQTRHQSINWLDVVMDNFDDQA